MKWLARACLVLFLGAGVFASHSSQGTVAQSRRPNLILILADDLGYETIGANGGTSYKTPVLDRLAATGVRFTQAYAQPLCTPTRVQLMTGHSNVRNYVSFGSLRPNLVTFGNLLKDAGYSTGMVGKWQLGRERDLPKKLGFDEYALWQHTRRPPRYANPDWKSTASNAISTTGSMAPTCSTSSRAISSRERRTHRSFSITPCC